MVASPAYDLDTQAKMVPAMCVLHNFIHEHDSQDRIIREEMTNPSDNDIEHVALPGELGRDITTAERNRANAKRDNIAQDMWDSYQRILRRRGEN